MKLIVDSGSVADPADLDCNGGDEDCFRVSVPFYFATNSMYSSFYASEMVIEGIVFGGTGVEIDRTLSSISSCEGSFEFDDSQEGEAFKFTFDAGTINFQSNANNPDFTLFIKARPGQDFYVDVQEVLFTIGSGPGTACELEEPAGIIDFDQSALTKVTPPTCTEDDVDLNLGTEDENTIDHYTDIPLELDLGVGNSATLDDYDVLIVVEDTYGNLEGVEFIQDQANLPFEDISVTEVSTDIYHIYLASEDVSEAFTADTDLGDIRIHHPSAVNVEGEANIYFDFARVFNDTEDECCSPDLSHTSGSPKEVTIDGHTPCTDYSLQVAYSAVQPTMTGCEDQEVWYDLFLTTTGSTPYTIKQLFVDLEFNSTGSVAIVDVDDAIGLTCPGDQCPLGVDDCYDYTGTSFTFELCTNTGVAVSQSTIGVIRIKLEADADACINDIVFTRSKIQVDGTPDLTCGPEYENILQGACLPEISGTLETANENPVEQVTLTFYEDGTANSCVEVETDDSACDGIFSECFFCEGAERTRVVPTKDINPRCGVTTYDLVLIKMHILNIEILDSPYKLIAADANNSGTISTLDLVEIQKVILLVEETFSSNTSWRFVDADYTFPTPTNPWAEAFPEEVYVELPTGVSSTADFIGVKIGDVNLSCNSCNEAALNEVISSAIDIKAGDDSYGEGDTITVTFQTDGNYDLVGYQIGLSFNNTKLTYLSTVCGGIAGYTPTQCGADTPKGEIRVLSYDTLGIDRPFTDSTTLFQLLFIAEDTIPTLDTLLTTDTTVLHGVAYDSLGSVYEMDFQYVDISEIRQMTPEEPGLQIGLYPNPVRSVLNLAVEDFPGGFFNLRVMDVNGRSRHLETGQRPAGRQLWEVQDLSALPDGVYFLQLITEEGGNTIRFLKISH